MAANYDSIIDNDVCLVCHYEDFTPADWCVQDDRSDELETDQNFDFTPDFQEVETLFDLELEMED